MMFIGILEVLLLKVQQSQWIYPISIDPDLDSVCSMFLEVLPMFLLEYAFAMYNQCYPQLLAHSRNSSNVCSMMLVYILF